MQCGSEPWRWIDPRGMSDARALGMSSLFVLAVYDTRKPADAVRLRAMTSAVAPLGAHFKVERFATFPRTRFPTFTDADVLRIDPSAAAR